MCDLRIAWPWVVLEQVFCCGQRCHRIALVWNQNLAQRYLNGCMSEQSQNGFGIAIGTLRNRREQIRDRKAPLHSASKPREW